MKKIIKVWTTETEIWVEREDGVRGFERFADYPRLRDATKDERNAYEVLPYGLHWEALDEDLCFEGFFNKEEHTDLYKFFMQHPELNASAIARRMGISQSLFAQYISGNKRPSAEREKLIEKHIQLIGEELMSVRL
ncbi:MAG: DUF2442 domain-containing protein [Fermentimonas sp.]